MMTDSKDILEDKIADLVSGLLTDGFNRSLNALRSAGAVDTTEMGKEYKGIGSRYYDMVTEQMELTVEHAKPMIRQFLEKLDDSRKKDAEDLAEKNVPRVDRAVSGKQRAYDEILNWSVLHIRGLSGSMGKAPIWKHGKLNRSVKRINALAYLIHRIYLSIHYADYTENDRGFIDWAIPCILREMEEELPATMHKAFIDFHDGCPGEWKPDLRWHPDDEYRNRYGNGQYESFTG